MQFLSQVNNNHPTRKGNKILFDHTKFRLCGGSHLQIFENPDLIKLQVGGRAVFETIEPDYCIGKDVFQFIDHSFERDITSQAYRWSFKKNLITLAPFVSLLRTAFDIHPVPIDTKPISDSNTIKIEVKRRKAKESSPSNQRYITVVR